MQQLRTGHSHGSAECIGIEMVISFGMLCSVWQANMCYDPFRTANSLG